jgi:uncharacterized protein YeaO (DUF488 family)
MSIHIIRLGSPRAKGEGPRLGTVRRPPRGVARKDIAARGYYDVWLPELSPSAPLVALGLAGRDDEKKWRMFARKYRAEMSRPPASRVLDALAALSHASDFSVGCYCDDESRCHRSILRELLNSRGAAVVDT